MFSEITTDKMKQLLERIDFLESVMPTESMLREAYPALNLTENELIQFDSEIQIKCDSSGLWLHSTSSGRGNYPTILRRGTSYGKQLKIKYKKKSDALLLTCSHIVLLAEGEKPYNYGYEASHLCHQAKCCSFEHLVWEPHWMNQRRNMCINKEKCICEMQPCCNPKFH